jgi:hypothetical protein
VTRRPESERDGHDERDAYVVDRVGERPAETRPASGGGVAEPRLGARDRSGEASEAAARVGEEVERTLRRRPGEVLAERAFPAPPGEPLDETAAPVGRRRGFV